MKRSFLIFFSICLSWFGHSQEYDVINAVFSNNTINLSSQFTPLDYGNTETKNPFTEEFLRRLWEPTPSKSIPDITPFLEDISIEHLNDFTRKKDTSEIDFSKLNANYKKVINIKDHLDQKDIVTHISRPFINCSKEWAVVLTYSYSHTFSGGGSLEVYRKVNGIWKLYRRMSTFMT